MPQLAIKIDVDTYRGLAEGASQLASFLRAQNIPASLFITMGPDNSGRAITRVFRHKEFARKMRRTNAFELYGLRTALSGTLLPARPIADSFPHLLLRWRDQGFEISPHGYDHIRWHDHAAHWSEAVAAEEIARTFEVYRRIFKTEPRSFAAPGWQAGTGSWEAMEKWDLAYHSDTRGEAPFFGSLNGRRMKTLEIPTTMPTWDEMLAWDGIRRDNLVKESHKQLRSDRVNVWTIHAEVEGGAYFPEFQQFIAAAQRDQVEWIFLPEWAERLKRNRQSLSACPIEQGQLSGRAGTVTRQSVHAETRV